MFTQEAVEGAIRLSKHRKSGKVELKDMALAIGTSPDTRWGQAAV